MLLLNLFIGTRRGSGIDNLAHVGGFVTGAILGLLLAPRAGGAPRGRWDGHDGATDGPGDGAILPPAVVRAALAATVVGYGLGLRTATRIALAVSRVYGRA